jgi:hypothetical protein
MIDPRNCSALQVAEEGCVLSFHFDPIYFRKLVKYCVTAVENNNTVCLFFMEQVNERWKIINAPQISNRFMRMEALLSDFLCGNTVKADETD